MFSHRYRYFFISALALYSLINTELCDVYYYFHIDIHWYHALLTIFLITLITWEGNRILEPFLKKWIDTDRFKIRYLAVFYMLGNVLASLAALISVWLVGSDIMGLAWKDLWVPLKLNLLYAGLINLFFHLLNAILFFFHAYKKKWMEAEELKRISAQSQLQLIKSQINPHFLFNNLNVLSGMLMRENSEANRFIEEFSRVYRYILNNHEKELVTVQSELEFVEPYIFLLQKRFNEGLQISVDIPARYKNYYIIPVALQMLIENAIKHNVMSRSKPLHITLHANGNETLIVSNNLQPKQTAEPSSRIGLQNIRQRYELVSGKTVEVKQTETSFEVIIPLLHLN